MTKVLTLIEQLELAEKKDHQRLVQQQQPHKKEKHKKRSSKKSRKSKKRKYCNRWRNPNKSEKLNGIKRVMCSLFPNHPGYCNEDRVWRN